MPRFDRLEIDPSSSQPEEPDRSGDELRDEQYWLQKADAERRRGFFENSLRMYSRSLEMDKS
jgi:hypothetical protein